VANRETPPSLNSFVTRFGSASQFDPGFFTNMIRTRGDFTVTLAFRPSHSRVRWMLSQALNAGDANPDFQFYVYKMTPPNFRLNAQTKGMTGYEGMVLQANDGQPNVEIDQHNFTMSILSTEYSLAHHVFYYWMKECAAPYWSYVTTCQKEETGFMASVKSGVNNIVNSFKDAFSSSDNAGGQFDSDQQQTDLSLCYPYTVADIYVRRFSGEAADELETLVLENCFPFMVHNYNVDNDEMFQKTIEVKMHCANAYISSPFIGKTFQSSLTSSVAGQLLEENVAKYVKRVWGHATQKAGTWISDGIKKVESAMDVIGNAASKF